MVKVLIEELPNGALDSGKLYFTDDTPIVRRKQTNADRIRAMSDKELAEWLLNHDNITAEKGRLSKDELLQWLKSEVKE